MTRKGKIVCVEDEIDIRRDIADELREAGYSVREAGNGLDALELIGTDCPDLVLCDVNMPGSLNGFEVLETLRQMDGEVSNLPFIFLTAFGDRNDILIGRGLGADDYLVKPVDFDILLATVDTRLLNVRRAKEQADTRIQELEARIADLLDRSTPSKYPGLGGLLSALGVLKSDGLTLLMASFEGLHQIAPRFGRSVAESVHRHCIDLLEGMFPDETIDVYQIEGNTFAILVPGSRHYDSLTVAAERLLNIEIPIDRIRVGIESTVVVARTTAEDPRSARQLFDDSFLAMQHERRSGARTLIRLDDISISRLRGITYVEENFVRALREGEMSLVFQPKIRLSDNSLAGAEALIRWHSPNQGQISPSEFIPIVERCGFAEVLSDWVLDEVCRSLARIRGEGIKSRIAVNASGAELKERFPERVEAALRRHGVPPQALEVEITETSVVLDMPFASRTMEAVRRSGIRVAVDDFGTGYSSLSYLRSFPLDIVKVDQSFVRGLAENPIDRQIVDSVLSLTKAINLESVAEGVETAAQMEILRQLGCDVIQGYHAAKPMPYDEFVLFAKERS